MARQSALKWSGKLRNNIVILRLIVLSTTLFWLICAVSASTHHHSHPPSTFKQNHGAHSDSPIEESLGNSNSRRRLLPLLGNIDQNLLKNGITKESQDQDQEQNVAHDDNAVEVEEEVNDGDEDEDEDEDGEELESWERTPIDENDLEFDDEVNDDDDKEDDLNVDEDPTRNETSSPPLQTFHTSLSTLLPILPLLSPPPSHTLVVTFATSAFKPLLFNWLCFFRYKAKWGEGGQGQIEIPKRSRSRNSPLPPSIMSSSTPKVLIVTSDESLAKELSQMGIVVWYLTDGIDGGLTDSSKEENHGTRKNSTTIQKRDDDLFLNLRRLNLLLPPSKMHGKDHDDSESKKNQANRKRQDKTRDTMIPWGTLQYQSLMLERTLVMSALVGALVESQKIDVDFQRQEEKAWWDEALRRYNEGDETPLEKDKFTGVKGVLVVDNDAVWLSSPSSFLTHPYRPQGAYPSILYAPDMGPSTRNAWGSYSMPCACFFYARTSDHEAHLVEPPFSHEAMFASKGNSGHNNGGPPISTLLSQIQAQTASEGAANVWRHAALCHIAMLRKSLREAKVAATEVLRGQERSSSDDGEHDGERRRDKLQWTRYSAPSFQASALGPALYLAQQALEKLKQIGHEEWMARMRSGKEIDLLELLEEARLEVFKGMGEDRDKQGEDLYESDETCVSLAASLNLESVSPNRGEEDPATLLTIKWRQQQQQQHWRLGFKGSRFPPRLHPTPIRAEALPYDLFPPGVSYFGEGEKGEGWLDDGVVPCVVHANYATGNAKRRLLEENGLWALRHASDLGRERETFPPSSLFSSTSSSSWSCDSDVLEHAGQRRRDS